MILYHSSNKIFDKFDNNTLGKVSNVFGTESVKRSGIFLSDDSNFSAVYGNILYTVDVDIGKCLDLRNGFQPDDILILKDDLSERWMESLRAIDIWNIFDGDDGEFFVEILSKKGYDTVSIKEECPKTSNIYNSFVVLDVSRLNIVNREIIEPKKKLISKFK